MQPDLQAARAAQDAADINRARCVAARGVSLGGVWRVLISAESTDARPAVKIAAIGSGILADMRPDFGDQTQQIANASAMAAGPALAEALRDLLAVARAGVAAYADAGSVRVGKRRIVRAETALALADGRATPIENGHGMPGEVLAAEERADDRRTLAEAHLHELRRQLAAVETALAAVPGARAAALEERSRAIEAREKTIGAMADALRGVIAIGENGGTPPARKLEAIRANCARALHESGRAIYAGAANVPAFVTAEFSPEHGRPLFTCVAARFKGDETPAQAATWRTLSAVIGSGFTHAEALADFVHRSAGIVKIGELAARDLTDRLWDTTGGKCVIGPYAQGCAWRPVGCGTLPAGGQAWAARRVSETGAGNGETLAPLKFESFAACAEFIRAAGCKVAIRGAGGHLGTVDTGGAFAPA